MSTPSDTNFVSPLEGTISPGTAGFVSPGENTISGSPQDIVNATPNMSPTDPPSPNSRIQQHFESEVGEGGGNINSSIGSSIQRVMNSILQLKSKGARWIMIIDHWNLIPDPKLKVTLRWLDWYVITILRCISNFYLVISMEFIMILVSISEHLIYYDT
jgi:hypothetical protein